MSSIEFDTPANRIISQFAPKDKFGIQLLPDITFLRQLSIQGRLRYFQGTNATDPFITITPNVGETFFIYKIVISNNALSGNAFTFVNDSQTRMVVRIAPLDNGGSTQEITFMDSLVGDGTKTMTINGSQDGDASIFGWVENTSRIRDVTS